ncbi:MAG: hypothetical protein J5502_00515 [Prevotella sp.]|nr:hypothetical protein [Prevotella sp.]
MIPSSLKQECWSDDDWFYICGLSKAIEKVNRKYICVHKDEKVFHLEHVFAYELYCKWKGVLSRRGGNPQKLLLNGELTKHYCKPDIYRFPDLVLHKNYERKDMNGYQCIICEIKSSRHSITTNALRKDILSLYDGITDLSYKCGVFIFLGEKIKRMITRLRKIIQILGIDTGKKFLFIGTDGNNCYYEIL